MFFIIIPECIVLLKTLILNNIPKDEDDEVEPTEEEEDNNQQVVAEAMVELSSTGINKLDQQHQQGFHIQNINYYYLPKTYFFFDLILKSFTKISILSPIGNIYDLVCISCF